MLSNLHRSSFYHHLSGLVISLLSFLPSQSILNPHCYSANIEMQFLDWPLEAYSTGESTDSNVNLASCPAKLNLFTVLDSIFNFVIYSKATGNTLFCVFSFIEIAHLHDKVTPGRHHKQLIFSQTDNRNKKCHIPVLAAPCQSQNKPI